MSDPHEDLEIGDRQAIRRTLPITAALLAGQINEREIILDSCKL